MTIDWVYKGVSDISLNINIADRVAIFLDGAGTGKTFMFQMLASYCVINNIPYEKFNYSSENKDFEWFKLSIKKADIVIMDNADLYMTPELFDYLKSCDKQVLISIKHPKCLTTYENCGFYKVKYVGSTLMTVKKNYGLAV